MAPENRELYWNGIYRSANRLAPGGDDWIYSHLSQFSPSSRVIELGCGLGFVSEKLKARGFVVTATDIAQPALEALAARVPGLDVRQLDLEEPFPFAESFFDVAVADLCLHYFDSRTTRRIVSEIDRVLRSGGRLCARVNAATDVNYGAGAGREIERGFYEQDGHYKRFFDRQMIDEFFSEWKPIHVKECELSRFGKPKQVFELAVEKRK